MPLHAVITKHTVIKTAGKMEVSKTQNTSGTDGKWKKIETWYQLTRKNGANAVMHFPTSSNGPTFSISAFCTPKILFMPPTFFYIHSIHRSGTYRFNMAVLWQLYKQFILFFMINPMQHVHKTMLNDAEIIKYYTTHGAISMYKTPGCCNTWFQHMVTSQIGSETHGSIRLIG